MSNKLEQIKRILKEYPVTDPRGAMLAIEVVIETKPLHKKAKPVLRVDVFDKGTGVMDVIMFGSGPEENLEPKYVGAVIKAMKSYAAKRAEQACEGCDECVEKEGN